MCCSRGQRKLKVLIIKTMRFIELWFVALFKTFNYFSGVTQATDSFAEILINLQEWSHYKVWFCCLPTSCIGKNNKPAEYKSRYWKFTSKGWHFFPCSEFAELHSTIETEWPSESGYLEDLVNLRKDSI